jgi:hypothetical protein
VSILQKQKIGWVAPRRPTANPNPSPDLVEQLKRIIALIEELEFKWEEPFDFGHGTGTGLKDVVRDATDYIQIGPPTIYFTPYNEKSRATQKSNMAWVRYADDLEKHFNELVPYWTLYGKYQQGQRALWGILASWAVALNLKYV